jgi:hypothetical protein
LPHLREKQDKEIHKTALGAEDMVDIYASDDIRTDLLNYKQSIADFKEAFISADSSTIGKIGNMTEEEK